ncbi:MAG: glycine cleavage system protein GcvH [Candidatus Eisenbacteria bacterium]|uniref:Glycine cleavage system H protein n=1 Tax=Eiseniibacteriota bacterium TaxID=2212470 RepID=A0A956RNQ6_UNCEI|nr:glycine cleavage system protein GcvH [Candidatus Eisenbacteria bacterium]
MASHEIPGDLRYTKEHEWVKVDGTVAMIGVTDFAQASLGDVVFVELPQVGDALTQNEPFGSVEAVKAVSDLFSPVSGEVSAVNEGIENDPSVVNRSPYGDGWMIKASLSDASELDDLMSAEEYAAHVAGLEQGA